MADIRRLPRPIDTVWDWQIVAACRDMDSDAFFHPERERKAGRVHREQTAQQVCRACPVIDDCRRHALAVEEPYGVWGGLTETDREQILRERRAVPREPL